MRKSSRPFAAAAAVVALAAVSPAVRAQMVTGQVAGEGLAIESVRVELHPLPSPFDRIRLAALGEEAEAAPLDAVRPAPDGSFRLAAPAPGMFRVVARAPGRVAMRRDLVPLVEDAALPPVELLRATTLPVRVRGPEGEPIGGARVMVRSGRGPVWLNERRRGWVPAREDVTTDEAGSAAVPFAEGEAELALVATAPGWWGGEIRAAPRGEAALALAPAVEREVVVRRPGGPVAGAGLWVAEAGGRSVLADAEGRARLTLPAGEPAEVRVETADRWRKRFRVRTERPPPGEARPPLVVELDPPARLPAQVVSADDREPVAGALIWLLGEDGWTVSTGPDGAAVVAVVGAETAELHAAAPGFREVSLQLAAAEWPRTGAGLVLPLEPSGTVAGVVVDPQGAALPGSRVLLRHSWAAGSGWEPGARGVELAEPDAEGRFRFGGLDRGRDVMVRAEAPGRATVETDARIGDRDLRLVLGLGGAVGGRVRSHDGGAITDGTAHLFAAGSGSVVEYVDGERMGGVTARLAEDGAFRLARVPAGTHELVVRVPGHEPATLPGVEVEEGGEVDLGRIDLRPEVVLDGRVAGAEGEPVAGATVLVTQELSTIRARRSVGRSGSEVETDAEGYLETRVHAVRLPIEEPLEVRLRRGASVFGRVVAAAGAPVAGARVELLIDPSAPPGLDRQRWTHAIDETDDEGRFDVAGVPLGPLALRVSGYPRRMHHEQTLDALAEGERLGPLTVELPVPIEIGGRVVRADGSPAAGAEVTAIREEPGGSSFGRGARADPLGRYVMQLDQPGQLRIVATLGIEERVETETIVGEGRNGLDLILEPTTGLAGVVFDAEGRPAGRGVVRLLDHDRLTTVPIADRGRFSAVGIEEGTYRVTAEAHGVGRGELPEPVAVRRGLPVDGLVVRLAAGARVSGRVLGLAAEDLQHVTIAAMPVEERFVWNAPVGRDGSFELSGLRAGRHQVTAWLSIAGRSESVLVEVPDGGHLEGVEIDFSGLTLTVAASVHGRPLDQPARIETADGRGLAGSRRLGPGRFAFEGLEPGRYRVAVRASPGGPEHSREVEVTSDQNVALDFEGWPVAGWALDPDGDPVPGVAVAVVAPEEEVPPMPWGPGVPGVAPDASGRFELPAVPPGRWRLVVFRAGWWGEAIVEVPPGGVAGVTIELEERASEPLG